MPFFGTFLSVSAYLPNALSMTLLSILMLAGMVRISLYPLAAAAIASPIPVLPDVGSTSIVLPSAVSTYVQVYSYIMQLEDMSFFRMGMKAMVMVMVMDVCV